MHTHSRTTTADISPYRISPSVGLVILVALFAVLTSMAHAGQSSARAVAMGGAYMGLADGVDAARLNPANLGLTDYRRTAVEFVGVGAAIQNNAFTLSDYNKYTGAVLTDSDKDYILDQIPQEGLKLSANAEAAAVSATVGQFGFTVTGVGAADINLSRDIFELVFNGNAYADTIDVTGSYSEAISYVSAGLSYGLPVFEAGTRQIAVGASVKYLHGIAVEEVVELEGLAVTEATGFAGEGHMLARTATGGSGFGFDVGGSIQINKDYTAGIAIRNLYSTISWSSNAEEHGYEFTFDTTNIENADGDQVVSNDYSREIDGFSTTLPAVMTIGLARRTGDFRWALDYEQGFSRFAGASTTPRLAAGVELTQLSVLPIRVGFATGGDRNTSLSFGSGLHFASYYLDFAVVGGSSFSGYSTKGLNLAISTGLQF